MIEDGTHSELIEFLCINGAKAEGGPLVAPTRWLSQRMRWLQQYNPLWRAEKNVAHHYDLSGALYELFLDHDRQYSCAYFMGADDTLEAAQENKNRHIAAKLLLEPGQRRGVGLPGCRPYAQGTAIREFCPRVPPDSDPFGAATDSPIRASLQRWNPTPRTHR